MKCYASDYCQKDKSSCSDVCGGYRVLRALYNLSRIPERYRYTIALKPENGEDLEAFTTLDNYKNDVLSMVDEGRGLYIWGKSTGNGKTSWACKIMSYFFRKIAFNTGAKMMGDEEVMLRASRALLAFKADVHKDIFIEENVLEF